MRFHYEISGIVDDMDDGCVEIAQQDDADAFVAMCRDLRFWQREPEVRNVKVRNV
jgi:catalase